MTRLKLLLLLWRLWLFMLMLTPVSFAGPMRNYTNGYHPAGGADPRYLNYGVGVQVPYLVNPRIPDQGISLRPQHHLKQYIGVRPGLESNDYVYTEQYNIIHEEGERRSNDADDRVNLVSPNLVIPQNYSAFYSTSLVLTNNERGLLETFPEKNQDYDGSGYSDIIINQVAETQQSGKIHCHQGTVGYRSGDVFHIFGDPCTKCNCTRFGPKCDKAQCPPLPAGCFELIRRPNECCSVCVQRGCFFRNLTLMVDQIIQLTSCDQCQCKEDGRVYCSVADCTPPPCVDALLQEGHCCPVCPNGPNCHTDTRTVISARNEWVNVPDQPCTLCRCWHKAGTQQLWMGNRKAECKRDPNCNTDQM